MKGYLVLLSFVVCVALAHCLTDEEKQKLSDIHKKCQSNPETNADESDIVKLIHNNEEVATRAKVEAHLVCMSKNAGLQDAEGQLNKKFVKDSLAKVISDSAKLDDVIEKCVVDKGTAGETVVEYMRCLHNNGVHVLADQHQHHHHH